MKASGTLKTYLQLEEIALKFDGTPSWQLSDAAREVMDVLRKRLTPQEWVYLNDRENL